ncbi:MAG TPA: ATP-binding protein [Anaerolineales bacterium]|nr:ATP-binding protein [Anaerolineales bacterium]
MGSALILVADDSRDIRQVLEETILGPAGYDVRSVGDGMSALTLALELKPDLVITDHQMPNLTGVDLIRRLHLDSPQIPVILMTGESSEALAISALRAGAIDYLVKPFDPDDLLGSVDRALGLSKRRAAPAGARSREETEGLERRLEELETIARIGRTVTAMLDLDEVLTTVVDAAVRLTEAEEGSLLLLDEESGELTMRASKNFDEEFARTFRLRVQDSLAGQVIASGEPFLLEQTTPQKIKTSYLVHSLVYVPMQSRGKFIGVLGVDNRTAGRALTREDVAVMVAMANYASIAIENAQLYNRTESERRKLETILTQTENGVIVVDPERRLLLINRSACEAFQVEQDAVGRLITDVIEDGALLNLVLAPGDLPRREEVTLKDGRIWNAQRTPIPGVGQAIVMQDITHLKELDRIKSEFVTTVSHDLRSPLTAILGYVELIERAGEVNAQQKEFVRRVQLSVEQITNLVNDLLDLGRIEAGLDTNKENTPITVIARYAIDGLRGAAEAAGLMIEAALPDELPLVHGDPIRLRQMVGNLIENSIKYTPAGGRIRLEAHAQGEQVILRVSDTGRGIPAADQPYLFDKFYRASNVPDDSPGTGLGLSIVKSIVDNHQGRIWVDSKLGEGATFSVVLPKAMS